MHACLRTQCFLIVCVFLHVLLLCLVEFGLVCAAVFFFFRGVFYAFVRCFCCFCFAFVPPVGLLACLFAFVNKKLFVLFCVCVPLVV